MKEKNRVCMNCNWCIKEDNKFFCTCPSQQMGLGFSSKYITAGTETTITCFYWKPKQIREEHYEKKWHSCSTCKYNNACGGSGNNPKWKPCQGWEKIKRRIK